MSKSMIGVVAAVTVVAAGVLVAAAPASAGKPCTPTGGAFSSKASADAVLKCPPPPSTTPTPSKPGDTRKTSKATKPACVWVPKPDYQPGPGQPAEGAGGHWYMKFCSFGVFTTLADFEREMGAWDVMNTRQTEMMRRAGLEVRFFITPPTQTRPTPEQVMAWVVDSLPFPDTFFAVSPAPPKQVVHLPTWAWLTDAKGRFAPERYQQKSKTIQLVGYPLQWQIVPQMTLSPGDGGSDVTCDGAGLPWSREVDGDPTACAVSYERPGQYTLSASVEWTVQWWLGDVRQPDIPGPTKTADRRVTVLTIEALNR